VVRISVATIDNLRKLRILESGLFAPKKQPSLEGKALRERGNPEIVSSRDSNP